MGGISLCLYRETKSNPHLYVVGQSGTGDEEQTISTPQGFDETGSNLILKSLSLTELDLSESEGDAHQRSRTGELREMEMQHTSTALSSSGV